MLYSYESDKNNINPRCTFASKGSMSVFALTPEEILGDVSWREQKQN